MSATPETGVLKFIGQSGREYSYSVYASDVAAAFLTFATTAAAGSGSTTFIIAPENMTLQDVSMTTGVAVITVLTLWLNDAPVPGSMIQYANVLSTIQNRAFPHLMISGGRKVQFQQN